MATLVMILALFSPNFFVKVLALKKSLKIQLVPFLASGTRFSAGSNPTSMSPCVLYERRRVPSLQPMSTTMSLYFGRATSHAFVARSERALRIVGLITDLNQ